MPETNVSAIDIPEVANNSENTVTKKLVDDVFWENPHVVRLNLNNLAKTPYNSGDLANLVNAMLSDPDRVYTFPRIMGIEQVKILGQAGAGAGLDHIAHHPIEGLLIVALALGMSMAAFGVRSQEIQTEKNNHDINYLLLHYLYERAKLKKDNATETEIVDPDAIKKPFNPDMHLTSQDIEKYLGTLNTYFTSALQSHAELGQNYEKAELECVEDAETHKKTYYLVLHTKPQASQPNIDKSKLAIIGDWISTLLKGLHELWNGLSLASYTYWIVWFSAVLFTGAIASGAPILGTFAIGFAIPLAVGATYLIAKAIDYFSWVPKPEDSVKLAAEESSEKLDKGKGPLVEMAVVSDEQEELLVAENQKIELVIKGEKQAAIYNDMLKLVRSADLRQKVINAMQITREKTQVLSTMWKIENVDDNAYQQLITDEINAKIAINKPVVSPIQVQTKRLTRNKWLVISASFLTVMGAWAIAQFNAWILSDIAAVAFHVSLNPINLVLGGVLLGIACAVGIYNMVQKKNMLEADIKLVTEDKAPVLNKIEQEFQIYEVLQKEIAAQQLEIRKLIEAYNEKHVDKLDVKQYTELTEIPKFDEPQYCRDIRRTGPTETTNIKKFIGYFLTGTMAAQTGVLLFRFVAILGQAIFIPICFGLPPSAIVATTLLAAAAVAYLIYKLIDTYKNRQESEDHNCLKQLDQRLECLEQQNLYGKHFLFHLKKRAEGMANIPRSVSQTSIGSSGSDSPADSPQITPNGSQLELGGPRV